MGYSRKKYHKKQKGGIPFPKDDFNISEIYNLIKDPNLKKIVIRKMSSSFLFTKDGQIRHFGLGKKDSSIIPIWLLVIIIVIFIYMSILCYLRY